MVVTRLWRKQTSHPGWQSCWRRSGDWEEELLAAGWKVHRVVRNTSAEIEADAMTNTSRDSSHHYWADRNPWVDLRAERTLSLVLACHSGCSYSEGPTLAFCLG